MGKIIARIIRTKNIEYYLLSFILLLGFLVRLYKINNPVADWHAFRQADTASVSRLFLESGINLLIPRYYDLSSTQSRMFNPQGYRFVEFPIYNAIHAILAKYVTAIPFEVWGRLVSVFFALGSGYLVFLIGKKFLGKWGGVLSSFFFLLLPYNVYFTRVILPEPMAVFFSLAGVYCFIKYFDEEKDLFLYVSGIWFALGLLIKPFILFYTIPLIYLLLQKYGFKGIFKTRRLLVKLLIYLGIILVPFILWRAWMSRFPAGIPEWKWMFNGDGIRFRPAFFRWIFAERFGRLILGYWGLIPFVLGILATIKKNLFNLMFFIGMLFYVIIFATVNVRHDYYQMYLIPAMALLLAQGVIYMWKSEHFNRILSRTILIFSVLIMFEMGAFQAKEYYKINHPEIFEAGKAIDRIAPKNAIIVAPYNGDTTFLYYTKRKGWPVVDNSIDEIIKRGATYYVSISLNDTDTLNFSKRFKTVEKTPDYIILDLTKPIAK